MIIDVHSHVWWYPDHLSPEFASEALAAKRVKMQMSAGGVYQSSMDLHVYDSTPEMHYAAAQRASKTVVFGLQARACGIWVPNDVIADYAAEHPDTIIGWASVDPTDAGHLDELERCVADLGLTGLKLGPAYQRFDPRDDRYWPVLARCEELGLPVLWHQGATFPTAAKLGWAQPMQLEDAAMAFPNLRMIIAHLGHPWEIDTVVLMRKCPNVYADVSACHYRPWRYWQALVSAYEYGVTHKLLLGSDFPSGTIETVIDGLRKINHLAAGTAFPRIPDVVIDDVIERNAQKFFQSLRTP